MDIIPIIVSLIVIGTAVAIIFGLNRSGKARPQPSRAGRTNASDTGDTSSPMWFIAGASHHDSGHSGGYSGGDSGGGDGGGGGGGE